MIWSVYLIPTKYNLQKFHLWKRILVNYFHAHNLYFHLPIVITSGISIVISISFTRVETLILLYTSMRKVSDYLLPTLFYPNRNSKKCGINMSIEMIGRYLDHLWSNLIYTQQVYVHQIYNFLIKFLIVSLFVITYIAESTRTYNWIGCSCDILWLFIMV